MPTYNPDNWLDIVGLVITGIVLVSVAWVSHRKLRAPIEEVKEQVQNGHSDTNLRDDIDKLTNLVQVGFAELRRGIAGLHEEMHTERVERIEGDRRGMRRIGLLPEDNDDG